MTTHEPRAWASFAENGNIRVWTSVPSDVMALANQIGVVLEPLYDQAALSQAVMDERTSRQAAQIENERLKGEIARRPTRAQIKMGRDAEREACAQLCEAEACFDAERTHNGKLMAAAIRARVGALPAREPMTSDALLDLAEPLRALLKGVADWGAVLDYARSIERHHDIGAPAQKGGE